MGVYIKDMKMPKSCFECMNSGLRTTIRCTEWTTISAGLRENHRAISCHLTEVPEPHGRLIDADALVPDICHDWNGWRVPPDDYSEECIRKAPIVIEAEGE